MKSLHEAATLKMMPEFERARALNEKATLIEQEAQVLPMYSEARRVLEDLAEEARFEARAIYNAAQNYISSQVWG